MKDIILKIRSVLLDLGIYSHQELQDLSDEKLLGLSFKEDLALDSLDYILFVEKIYDEHQLTVLENSIWECHTIQDLLTQYKKISI